jgi:hypothetical protein
VTEIIRAGEPRSLGNIDTVQRDFRSQIDALTDAVRQLAGNPEIDPNSAVINDPLTAPYVLYVNPYIGADTFVSGDYVSAEDGTFETKMRRISLQRLECGYTEARPFRTINRAIIEAGIITSRDYLNLPGSLCGDLVSIVVSPGVSIIDNGPGSSVTAWEDGKKPTSAEVQAFNPAEGGVIMPRGCSVISLDLRKAIIRPNYVPTPAAELADYSNRTSIFRVTGGGYFFGFTVLDKQDATTSHHLLDCFQFASETQLDEFYSKIRAAFGGATGTGDINDAIAVPRESEYQITGPRPASASVSTDTVRGASPYIYNTSIRSQLGMCGIHADGSKVTGFRSMVVAQLTGVSLQNDYSCWQKYNGTDWVTVASGDDYINTSPDDIRMDPDKRSFHIRAVNRSILQLVSVFAIGQGVHFWTKSAGELTITNSNSNFGSVAALSEGFQTVAGDQDKPWKIEQIARGVDPFDKANNIKRIFLGVLDASEGDTDTILNLTAGLAVAASDPNQPELLTRDGYSLNPGDYLWVENPGGPDYRAPLDTTPFTGTVPDQIRIAAPLTTDNADGNQAPGSGDAYVSIANQRVYIRRFRDVRTVQERRYTLSTSTTGAPRLPVRDYIIQPNSGSWDTRLQAVAASSKNETFSGANVELRYEQRPTAEAAHDPTVYYRKADVVTKNNKHYFCVRNNIGAFDPTNWDQSYVHMEESYAPGGYFTNAQPILLFDKDTDQSEDTTTCGSTIADVTPQIVSAVDYQGVFQLLLNEGYSVGAANSALELQPAETRNLDVSANDWNVEYRRPSNIRLFSHAYEWAGYLNYSKGLPQYQKQLSPNNQFTYFFTNQGGGKVYASGFNQEGLQVSPRGLEDITTGQVLSLENIGNPDRTIDFPDSFLNLTVDQLTVNNLQINGTITGADATTTEKGIVELATQAETRALADRNRVVTPNSLNGVRGFANTFASLDSNAKVPVAQLPTTNVGELLTLTPVIWVPGDDNLSDSSNFTYEQTANQATVTLGTPQGTGYEGSSGFIVITRDVGATTPFTGINDPAWRAVTNTWVNPTTNTPGLTGDVLIGYYVASAGSFIYTASMLD